MLRSILLALLTLAGSLVAAEEMPQLPPTAEWVDIYPGTTMQSWSGRIVLRSELYRDELERVVTYYEIFYLPTAKHPIRMTWREAFGEAVVIWTAEGFEDFEGQP